MLLSMTGHGEAQQQQGDLAVTVEVRTVNSRYFKLTLRCLEGFLSLESRVEGRLRQRVRRGTTQVSIHINRGAQAENYRINRVAFDSYYQQVRDLLAAHGESDIPWNAVLRLPGVVDESAPAHFDEEQEWAVIEPVLEQALAGLEVMRQEEGSAMEADFRRNLAHISERLKEISGYAPRVVESYRERMTDRLTRLLEPYQVNVTPADVVREVGVFAERCDISEEIVRLRSHLEQFDSILNTDESQGKKLEFLIQEMFRETNTIGAKANDADIARGVVDMKSAIERMREMVQNVE